MTEEKYERPAEIAAELDALPSADDPTYLTRLGSSALEVIVIARRLAAGGPLQVDVDEILANRALPAVRAAVFRHSRVPPEDLLDAQQEAMATFWEEIQKESFFEVRFNLALKRLAQRVGERIRGGKQRARERSAERLGSPRGAGDEQYVDVADDDDQYEAIHNRMLVEAVLDVLPEEQARALALHYLMELPAFSKDPVVRTVASELGWAERKTRQILKDGRTAARLSIDQEEE